MSIFQKAYDAIKNWTAPAWLKALIQQIQDLIVSIALQVGQQYINYLKEQVIYAAGQSWSSEEKFDYVFKKAKSGLIQFSITLKDSEINALIEFIVVQFKKSGVIK